MSEETENFDRDLELESDDSGEQHHAIPLLEDLPDEQRKEIEEQIKQIEKEAEENPEVGH